MTHDPKLGRPETIKPVCIIQSACSWLRCSVYIDRMTAMSSAWAAIFGRTSENSSPDLPCVANLNGLCSRLPVSFSSSATSAGAGLPSYLANIGFGSKRSIWLGPPCMKS